ncbi:protein AHNAK2 isoform X1 [Nothobranchius furzeri]|uniref:protein AHNAK2 isoform X1 n=1 Tax=Nothobranchius furzeri TaxID=105023 RepID=UPI003904836F
MCDCFHLAFPNWHAASSGIGARRRLEGPESTPEDNSACGEPTQFTEGERPRPQGSSPVEEDPEAARYDRDKKSEAERDSGLKSGSGPKAKKSGFVSMFEKRSSTPKMRKVKQGPSSLEAGVIVETTRDGCSEGLIYGGGGKDGIFIKKVLPESPASKSLKVKEGDQILSATVYFDNMPFEDAVQILEHAQAYKVKLCLKRTPELETDPVLESANIPEEEFCSAEMKEQVKSRSREDARISWPKISTFGKERKSCFTRSHSTSEADEQRNPELSPTTSDTESSIKFQDALKGKKKHRTTLSALTKRSHTSLSEDAQTGQVSGQTQESDLTSPEDLEGVLGVEVNMTEGMKVENHLKPQTRTDAQGIQHKRMDAGSPSKAGEPALTVAGQESLSIKSPDGKKKKKEKSELKLKSPGKEKSHKKDSDVKLSPRRLKTLGASFDTEDQLDDEKLDFISNSESNKLLEDHSEPDENKLTVGGESSRVTSSRSMTAQISFPKVELDLSDVAFVRKSPHKDKKKGQKQKQTSKQLRKVSSEEIQNINESTAQTGNVSSTQLPKREDMEIPGMEDMSVKAQVRKNKKQKGGFIVKTQDSQAEAVQLFIDVNSVKEAVSKLPGFKLPQVDTSGVPIPEEKTVIDANAQRIFMKTPTKVVEPGRHQEKHEAHFSTIEILSQSFKPANITSAGSTSAGPLPRDKDPSPEVSTCQEQETVQSKGAGGVKPESDSAVLKTSQKKIKTVNITMPSFELSPEIRIPEMKKDKEQARGVTCDVQTPELVGIEFIDSVDESAAKKEGGVTSCGIRTSMEGSVLQITCFESEDQTARLSKPRDVSSDISGDQKTSEIKTTEQGGRASRFKLPHLSFSVPKIKGPKPDFTTSKQEVEVAETQSKAECQVPEGPENEAFILKEMTEAEKPELKKKLPETREELGKQESKVKRHSFEMGTPTFKDPEVDLNLLKINREVKAPDMKAEAHGSGEYQAEAEKTHLKIQTVEAHEKQQGSRFKIPKFGIKIPKIKSHEFITSHDLYETEVHHPETSEVNVSPGKVDMDVPNQKQEPVSDDGETQATKFTFPRFTIAMPKIKGPEFYNEISKKDPDAPLPETKAEVQIPPVTRPDISTNISMSQEEMGAEGPEQETKPLQMEGEPDERGRFKIPKFGIQMPKLKGPDFDVSFSTKDAYVILPEATAETVPEEKLKAEKPQLETEPVQMEGGCDGQGPKFRTPKPGIAIPSLKGPKVDVSLSKPEDGVRLSETKEDVERVSPGLGLKVLEAKCLLDGKEENIKPTKSGIEIHLGPKTKAPASKEDVSDDMDRSSSTNKNTMSTNVSFFAPKFKCPDLDLGLPRKQLESESETEVETELKLLKLPNIDVDLGNAETLMPEGKVEAGEPAVQIKISQTHPKHPSQEGWFKMPKLGITMPKEKEPETHLNVLEEDTDEILTKVKIEGKIPNAELEEPAGKLEQSRSKFKVPSFNLSKFRSAFSFETPEVKKEIKTEESTFKTSKDKDTTEQNQPLVLDMGTEGDGDSTSLPQVHELAANLGSSNRDANLPKRDTSFLPEAPKSQLLDTDITSPRATAEFCLPSADAEPSADVKPAQTEPQTSTVKGSPSKFKLPAFKFPKIGVISPNVSTKAENVEKQNDNGSWKVELCTITSEASEVQMSEAELSLSKKKGIDTDLVADLSAEMEAPKTKGVKVKEVSPSKFKMPIVKLPKLGFDSPSSILDKDAVTTVDTQGPALDMKTAETGCEGKQSNSKVSAPGFSVPPIKGNDMNLRLPKMDVTIPEAEREVSLGDAELKKVSIEDTSEASTAAATDDRSEPQFRFPAFKFGVSSTTEKESTVDKDRQVDTIVDVEAPKTETESRSIDLIITETEDKEKGNKFKLPSISLSLTQAKGPDLDFSRSEGNEAGTITQTIKRTKDQVQVLEDDLYKPSAEVEMKDPEIKGVSNDSDGSPSRFKMPTFKLPKFKLKTQSSTEEEPALDKVVATNKEHTKSSEEVLTVSMAAPSIETDGLPIDIQTTETEHERKGARFKLPSLGFSVSEIKGPDSGLSSSETAPDVRLPDTKAEVQLSEVKLKQPSTTVKDPEIKVVSKDSDGSPSRFKMPTFKLPAFKLKSQRSTEEELALDKDITTDIKHIQASEEVLTVSMAAPSIETDGLSVDAQTSETRQEGKGAKFKQPSLGFTVSEVKCPDSGLSSSKTVPDVRLPETNADVQLSDVKLVQPSTTVKDPEIKVVSKDPDGSPSRFKMPTFKLPTFNFKTQRSTEEEPALGKDVTTDIKHTKSSDEVLTVTIAAPSIETKGLSVDIQTTQTTQEEKGAKFKLPSLGFSVSEVKCPDSGLSSSKTVPDVRLPETKAEVQLSEVKLKQPSTTVKDPEIKVVSKDSHGSPSRFKMPTFKLPTFKLKSQRSTEEEPVLDKDITTDIKHIQASEEVLTVSMAAPSIETDGLSVDAQTSETMQEGKGAKFKLPSLGFSVSEVKCPDSGLSSSKTVPDVRLPETNADVQLSDVKLVQPSTTVEDPEIKVVSKDPDGSPSRFKMPTFKLPKFKLKTQSSIEEEPALDKVVATSKEHTKSSEEVLTVSIAAPSIETDGLPVDIQTTETEHERKGAKFKLPSLGFSVSEVKGPDSGLSSSQAVPDVRLPETKAEVQLSDVCLRKTSVEQENKSPEIKVLVTTTDGSPSKFKVPILKLPKIGLSTPGSTGEELCFDNDIKTQEIIISDEISTVSTKAMSTDAKDSSIDLKYTRNEPKEKEHKFKLPSLGFSVSGAKKSDINLGLSNTDKDVPLSESKAEVKLSEVKLKQPSTTMKDPEIKVVSKDSDGSPSRFKMPSFKLPKFKLKTQSSTEEEPALDKVVATNKEHTKSSEEVLIVSMAAPSIETDGLSVDIQTTETEHERKGAKFKLPSLGFSVSEIKGPDSGLSSSETAPDVRLPDTKAEVKLSEVKLKQPSTMVKDPEIKVVSKDSDGSPSRFKMPTFKLPTFKLKTQRSTEEEPALDKDVTTDIKHTKSSEEVLIVSMAAPSIETDGLSVDIQTTETEHERKGAKFKLPSLGFSVSEIKGPDSGLSSSETAPDVRLPETKAEVQLSDVKLVQPSTTVKDPEIKVVSKDSDGSPSRFKMPSFKLPTFKLKTQRSTEEEPALDKDITTDIKHIQTSEEVLTVSMAAPSIETDGLSVDIKTTETEHERKGAKFKLPSLGFTLSEVKGPDSGLSSSKTAPDVRLPETKAEVKLSEVKLKQPSTTVKDPEIKVVSKDSDGSPSRFKMPTFKLPKFKLKTQSSTEEEPALDKVVATNKEHTKSSEEVLIVSMAAPSIETDGLPVDIQTTETEHERKGAKFKLPSLGFSVSEIKGPDSGLSSSETAPDVRLPETNAKVQLSDVKLVQPSTTVQDPEIKVVSKDSDGSPSRFKMPTFKLPTFKLKTQSSSEEEPALNKDDNQIPERDLGLTTAAQSTERIGPSVEIKTPETEHEGEKGKFKLPSLAFSVPQVKGPDVDFNSSKTVVKVTGPEPKVTDVEQKQALTGVETKPHDINSWTKNTDGSPSKLKMPTIKIPKFGVGSPGSEKPVLDKDSKTAEAETEGQSADKTAASEHKGKESRFKLPTLGFSVSQTKETDFSLKADVDVRPPETKAQIKLPDDEVKKPSAKVEITAPGTDSRLDNVEESKSKYKIPTFKLPKLGASPPQVNMEEPLYSQVKPPTDLGDGDVEVKMAKSDIKMSKPKDMDTLKKHVDITHPAVKAEGQSSDGKQPLVTMNFRPPEIKPHSSTDTSPRSGVVIPQLGEELPIVKNEIIKADIRVESVDIKDTQLKKGLEEMLQEATAEGKLCRVVILQDVPTGGIKASLKHPNSGAGAKTSDVHVKIETNKAEVCLPGAGGERPPGATLSQAAELKKSKFSLPAISFSKSRTKEPEAKADPPNPDVVVPDVEVKVEHKIDLTVPELKAGADGKGSGLKGVGLSLSQKAADLKTTELKDELKFSKDGVKLNSASGETTASEAEAKSKDVRGSPLKFKLPTLKMPKFGSASQNIPTERHSLEKAAKMDDGKLQKEAAAILKNPTVGTKAATPETEPSMTETDYGELKRTTFKIPQPSLSKPKPEEDVPADNVYKQNQPELKTDSKGEQKSSKIILSSFGQILETTDVEFDVPKVDSCAEISKTVYETNETTIKHLDTKEKEARPEQDSVSCHWKGEWSSPEEPPKIPEIAQQKNDTSPVGQVREEEISPTCSVQSSDAFADISSTVTSEPTGPNLQSPTVVTVRGSYPYPGLGETLCDITRTERIPDESNITVSSTVEDTLRLESEQIHIITSKTERLTAVLEQPAGGLPVEPDAEVASWEVGGSKIFTKTMFEMHTVTEMSGDSSQSKEALVITKQVTRLSEPISGETASSIRRLRDSVHSDKMRFFDEADA